MRSASFFIMFVTGTLLAISACEGPPEFSTVPIIEFEKVRFNKTKSVIEITIGFEDNEGDLGVSTNEEAVTIYPTDAEGNYIRYGSSPDLPEYNTCDYDINPVINGEVVEGTIYKQIDPNHSNMFLKLYKKNRGVFEHYDVRFMFENSPVCPVNQARFLKLNTQPNDRPLQGSLTYEWFSNGFGRVIRPTDTLQLEVQIRDNAFHRSNVVLSPEFTLGSVEIE